MWRMQCVIWDSRDKSTTIRPTWDVEETKARNNEMDTNLLRAERLESLRKTMEDLRLSQKHLIHNEKFNVGIRFTQIQK